jgi:hypothetical protein
MNISGYRFGTIEIDGRTYTSDVIITPERVIDAWWRQRGHALSVADLKDVMAARPDVLLVGTGYFGRDVRLAGDATVPRRTGHSGARRAHQRGGTRFQRTPEGARSRRCCAAPDVLSDADDRIAP